MTAFKRLVIPRALSAEYSVVTECPLGAGAFGAVYRVHSQVTNLDYACKTIEYGGGSDVTAVMVEEEIIILKRLIGCPNIVTYRHSYHERHLKRFLILMEYCEGGSLETLIKDVRAKGIPLQEELVWNYALQMLRGLKHLHSAGINILHRDLKPANVVISGRTLKITDFGFSKRLRDRQSTSSQQGTPLFMAPELLRGQEYGHGIDVWALGVTLFSLITCEYPFGEDTIAARFNCNNFQCPDLPLMYSSQLRVFVKLLLSVTPSERPNVTTLLAQREFVWAGELWDLELAKIAFETQRFETEKAVGNRERECTAMEVKNDLDAREIKRNAIKNAQDARNNKRTAADNAQVARNNKRIALENITLQNQLKGQAQRYTGFDRFDYKLPLPRLAVPAYTGQWDIHQAMMKRKAEEAAHVEESPAKIGRAEEQPAVLVTETVEVTEVKEDVGVVRTVLHKFGDWCYKF